jgi:hypothetical protein
MGDLLSQLQGDERIAVDVRAKSQAQPSQPGPRKKERSGGGSAMDRLSGARPSAENSSSEASAAEHRARSPHGPAYHKQDASKMDMRGTQPPRTESIDKVIGGARVKF